MDHLETIGDIARMQAKLRPKKTALIFNDIYQSYDDFNTRTHQVANGLLALGTKPDERVAYLGKNASAYFEILMGVSKAGGVTCPLNWRLSQSELLYIIEDTGCKVLFCGDEFLKIAQEVSKKSSHALTLLSLSTYEAWRDSCEANDPNIKRTRQDDVLQIYTSGTTGRPKGVRISNNALLLSRARDTQPEAPQWNRWSADDVGLVAMPCFHIGGTGFGLNILYAGATGVIMPKFEAHAQLDLMTRYKITKQFLVPAALQIMLNDPSANDTDFSKLNYISYGASPIPITLMKQCMDVFGCGFVQKYGMTETSGSCVALPPEDHTIPENPRMKSVGKPLAGIELDIVDKDGTALPPGSTGEIVIRSGSNMSGYWNNPKATKAAFFDQGWLRTGDVGFLDDDGYLYLQDRMKDMIISGGENIYSAEVEATLRLHPDIIDVAVIAVPDKQWGEAVMACVISKPETVVTEADIIAHCRNLIAAYKCPKFVKFHSELPKNASGKVLKRKLRAPFWGHQEKGIN